MEYEILKDCFLGLISRQARKRLVKRFSQKSQCNVLVMTLVVKNEEDTIENSIRFHHAMGVDGFIVSTHNSTDKTNAILERLKGDGLVWKIYYRTTPDHKHSEWVNEMIFYARDRGADWVINADGDEFFYSDCLDLKKSIIECGNINALYVDSIFLFPDNKENFFRSTDFVVRPMHRFEAEMYGFDKDRCYEDYIGSQGCTKVIHKTRGFKTVTDGNHDVVMHKKKMIRAAGIRLYHYHIRNFKGYEEKVLRWISSARLMPDGMGIHMKHMLDLYEQGMLLEDYNNRYNTEVLHNLVSVGVVTKDLSVMNFMKKIGVLQ